MLCTGMGKAVKYVQRLEEAELKEKVGSTHSHSYRSYFRNISYSGHSQVPELCFPDTGEDNTHILVNMLCYMFGF